MRKVSFKLFQDERGTVREMFLDYFDVWIAKIEEESDIRCWFLVEDR